MILRWVLPIVAFLFVAGAGGLLVVLFGIVPIKASGGHWPITARILEFTMRRSIATYTLGMDVPPLDERRLVVMGASHYEIGCRPCHGSPELPRPRITSRMTPPPPYLPSTIVTWQPDELFYIVKHGIKFTGMPAWPAHQRDDEVWAVVAFLRRFPDLDAAAYREVAGTTDAGSRGGAPIEDLDDPQDVPPAIGESCSQCHGADGLGRGEGAFPKLAGQRPLYLDASLQAYARGERHSGIMEPIAAGLDAEESRALALYYARLENASPPVATRDAARHIELGARIANRGLPDQLVPACVECHGPVARRRNPHYPALAGQYADYLERQLTLLKEERRGGTAYVHIMRQVAGQLTQEQIRAVALYFASLPWDASGAQTP